MSAPEVWLSMVYACDEGHERRIYCGVGVEGPRELSLRPDNGPANPLVIPSPFGGPRCPECGAQTVHVRWSEDERFDPRPAPAGALCFVHPGVEVAARRWRRGGGSVFLGDTVQVPS